MKVNILSETKDDLIPDGWYTVFDELNEKDMNITVFDDQILGYQLMENSLDYLIEKHPNAQEILKVLFNETKTKPSTNDIDLILDYIKEEFKMPDYYTFEQRAEFDPKIIAGKMLDEIEDDLEYDYWLKDYYERNPILKNLYKAFYMFKTTVLDTLIEEEEPQIFIIDDRQGFEIIENYHNLDELYSELLNEYPRFADAKLTGISWSKKVYKRWLGICYKHFDNNHTIFINILLSSPQVSREAVKYIMYHELLHAIGFWKHDQIFRSAEWKYPDSENLDGELDAISLKYNINYKELAKLRFQKEDNKKDKIKDINESEDNNFLDDKSKTQIDSKFCRECGNELPLKAKFCDKCGSNVEY